MKLVTLLIFLVSLNLQAQDIPSCGLNTHEDIDACTLEDKLPMLLTRLYPDLRYKSLDQYNMADPCDPLTIDDEETEEIEVCPVWEPKKDSFTYLEQTYDADNNPELSFFDRLQMLDKPIIGVFESDLASWKLVQKDDLDFKLSIKDMKHFRRRMVKCGFNQPNMALLKKKIIEDKDILKRDCLNSHTAAIEAEDASTSARAEILKDIKFANSVQVDFIMLMRSGTKNPAKNKRLLTKLSTIKSLLDVGDIESARDEMSALTTNADLSQAAKDMVLSKLNSYLGQ